MEKDAVCSVCMDLFENNEGENLLTCLHSICTRCLKDFKCIPKNEHVCKICSEPFDVSNILRLKQDIFVAEQQNLCSNHKSKEVLVFCVDCKSPICNECTVETHSKHVFLTFDQAITQNKTTLHQELVKLTTRVLDIDKTLQDLLDLKNSFHQRLISLSHEIETAFGKFIGDLQNEGQQQLISPLESRRNALQEDLSKFIKGDIKTTELQKQALQTTKEHIELVQQYSKSCSIPTSSAIKTVYWQGMLINRIVTLQQSELALKPLAGGMTRFIIAQPSNILSCDIRNLGEIVRSSFDRDWKFISKPYLVLGTGESEMGQLNKPSGIAELPNGNIVISDYENKCLQVYDSEGAFVRSILLGYRVYHIKLSSENEIWAASFVSNQLLCISLQNDTILRKIKVKEPIGVTILFNGLIVATCDDNIVRAFSPDGTLKWTSTGNGFNLPSGVSPLNENELIICDYSHYRLQVLSASDGRFIRSICSGEIQYPNDVAVVPEKDMMIVAQNSQISIVKLDGSLVHEFGGHGSEPGQFILGSAGSVAILQDGRIAVADYNNHRVQIF